MAGIAHPAVIPYPGDSQRLSLSIHSQRSQHGSDTEGLLLRSTAQHHQLAKPHLPPAPARLHPPSTQNLPQSRRQVRVPPPGHTALGVPRAEGRRATGVGHVRSLTIMFSRAYLASQQFRNTGMNKFRKGGQNIYKNKSYSEKKPCSSTKKAINSQFSPCWEGSVSKLSTDLQKWPPSLGCSGAAEN